MSIYCEIVLDCTGSKSQGVYVIKNNLLGLKVKNISMLNSMLDLIIKKNKFTKYLVEYNFAIKPSYYEKKY